MDITERFAGKRTILSYKYAAFLKRGEGNGGRRNKKQVFYLQYQQERLYLIYGHEVEQKRI